MYLSMKDLRLIVEACRQLDLEYGRSDAAELAERARAELDARREEER